MKIQSVVFLLMLLSSVPATAQLFGDGEFETPCPGQIYKYWYSNDATDQTMTATQTWTVSGEASHTTSGRYHYISWTNDGTITVELRTLHITDEFPISVKSSGFIYAS